MQRLTPKQLALLIALTLVWGINWPVMKVGVTSYPPLTFRALSILLGVPVLGLALVVMKVPFRLPRIYWREFAILTITNMMIWHVCIILAVRSLSSGRAAILGYTMPIFSAILGALLFGAVMTWRNWAGVAAAALGVALLLWHEFTGLAGHPVGVALALFAASVWALGTQLLRRTRIELPTLTLTFWMTVAAGVFMLVLGIIFERDQWVMPQGASAAAIVYNAVLIFGFAHAAWFYLARGLPPVASTLSVMFIPVLGVFSGALWLGEILHWQDWAAVVLMVVAIASVLWPARRIA
ncbi:EamA family transporter [Caenimonas koreensis DSM 17982]|uniref:EamA family transporter n=1 Tax=Caenimonas koreensis DSM 17982 TaxID=1121255 RepID=A0A844ARM1_9BURK|nr:DMT family transporter [Caenimonas koreensis]MRD46714.1 EamA family transporter [Caenimonas koreensis DSM 17982]